MDNFELYRPKMTEKQQKRLKLAEDAGIPNHLVEIAKNILNTGKFNTYSVFWDLDDSDQEIKLELFSDKKNTIIEIIHVY